MKKLIEFDKIIDSKDVEQKFALFFLSYYISDGIYYIDDFHFDFEVKRMKFNEFGAGDNSG